MSDLSSHLLSSFSSTFWNFFSSPTPAIALSRRGPQRTTLRPSLFPSPPSLLSSPLCLLPSPPFFLPNPPSLLPSPLSLLPQFPPTVPVPLPLLHLPPFHAFLPFTPSSRPLPKTATHVHTHALLHAGRTICPQHEIHIQGLGHVKYPQKHVPSYHVRA